MGVLKNKTSKAKTRSRRSQWSKIEAPVLVECPQCRELRVPHRMCAACGFYKKNVADANVNVADKKETKKEAVKEKETEKVKEKEVAEKTEVTEEQKVTEETEVAEETEATEKKES